ncbi:sporulation integral membrane protein YtvI [Anaerobacillus alkalilacustris]|uniref:Sporulation integral membrane protein YtvI n=1 Tax=Anaerobacillus alkalilacustris TaxID=393763 RepID=A0A1S2LJ36_9BACI|nr:sporulation integral membrane protein YtvI [Anaerobacillus alkalilacustris]OIJ12396.1 sporulation integral membrane protein YtvI [Anaerobacillus alkalilacustris]
MNSNYIQILLRFLVVISVIIIGVLSSYFAFRTAYPFIIGLTIAFLINPFVNFFQEKFRVARWLSVSLVLFIIIGIFIGAITILISEIIMGTNYLSQSVPFHFQKLIFELKELFTEKVIPIYDQVTTIFYSLDHENQATVLTYIETVATQITNATSTSIHSILSGISEFLLGLPNLATVIIFSLLATFFISKDWYRLVFLYRKWTPNIIVSRTKDVMNSLKKAFIGYLFAQLTLISITCFIVLVGLILLKVDYPITIAFIIAIIDLLPYIGTGLIFIPWIFYTLFSDQLSLTIGLSILYSIVVIQRQLTEPKVLSSNIGVDPLATLLSLFVGYKLFGFLGLIIGPVLLVFIQALQKANVFRDLKRYIFKV